MRLFTYLAKGTLLVLFAVAAFTASAQDIHFSEFYNQASFLNPSLVGNYDGSFRLAAIYRNQWNNPLGKSGYSTFGADVDFCLLEGYLKTDKLAIGVGFFNDRSGAAGLSTTSANLTVAYHKGFGALGQHRLSVGLQGGFIQRRVDDPIFGDQFIDFNQSILNTTRENYVHSIYKFDFNAGVYWRSNIKDMVKIGVGLGMYHLITPGQSLVKDTTTNEFYKQSVFPRKFSGDLNLEIFLGKDKKWSLSPEFLVLYQAPFTEYLPGVSATYYFNTGFRNNNSISLGLRFRSGGSTPDAVIPMANVEFRNVRLGFAYDANISSLHSSTQNRGAFEVSLAYIGETIKSYKANKSLPSRRF